jgi:hypothetical protein
MITTPFAIYNGDILSVAILLDECFLDVFKLIDESVCCDNAARSYDNAEQCNN